MCLYLCVHVCVCVLRPILAACVVVFGHRQQLHLAITRKIDFLPNARTFLVNIYICLVFFSDHIRLFRKVQLDYTSARRRLPNWHIVRSSCCCCGCLGKILTCLLFFELH